MGCDIHLHTEVKINNRWHHYSVCNVERIYALFAKMANVRNRDLEIQPIAEPKGLPKNITQITAFAYERQREDAHSESWLSIPEIAELYQWVDQTEQIAWFKIHSSFGYLFGNHWGWFEMHREDYPAEIQDFRFVFWFDN